VAEVGLLVFVGGLYRFSGGTMGFATTLSIGVVTVEGLVVESARSN